MADKEGGNLGLRQWFQEGAAGLDDHTLVDFLNGADGPCCILVGALMCVGDRGVVQRLSGAGFTVERITEEAAEASSSESDVKSIDG